MAPGEETEAWLGRALKGEKRRISNVFGLGSYVGPGRANRPEDVRLNQAGAGPGGPLPDRPGPEAQRRGRFPAGAGLLGLSVIKIFGTHEPVS